MKAFSGCDAVSSFAGRSKKTVWDVCYVFNEVSPALCTLVSYLSSSNDQLDLLERFVVLLYDRISSEEKVNVAHKQLFFQKCRPMKGLPPSSAVLEEHTERAAYQAGHVWANMLVAVLRLPPPDEWG